MIMSRRNDQIDLMIMMYIGNMYEYKILCRRQFPHASAACRQARGSGLGRTEDQVGSLFYSTLLAFGQTDILA